MGAHTAPKGYSNASRGSAPQPRIRRRTGSVGNYPGREAVVRLVCAVLAEQPDERAEGRRYLGLEVLHRCSLTTVGHRHEQRDGRRGDACPLVRTLQLSDRSRRRTVIPARSVVRRPRRPVLI